MRNDRGTDRERTPRIYFWGKIVSIHLLFDLKQRLDSLLRKYMELDNHCSQLIFIVYFKNSKITETLFLNSIRVNVKAHFLMIINLP